MRRGPQHRSGPRRCDQRDAGAPRPRLMIKNDRLTHRRLDNSSQKIDKISRGTRVYAHVLEESRLLWTRGVAARETLSYLDRRGIDAEPALSGAGIVERGARIVPLIGSPLLWARG